MLSRTIAFIFGVLLLQQLASLPGRLFLAGLVLCLPLAFLLFPRPAARAIAALCFGFLWAALYGHWQLADTLDPALEGEEIVVEGMIASLPDYRNRRVRFLLETQQASMNGAEVRLPSRLRLTWYNDFPATLVPGQRWRLLLKLKRPWGMMNPGGFDYEGWLFAQGIHATGYVRGSGKNRLLDDIPWRAPLERLRFSLHQRLKQALDAQPASGVIIALALGERGGIGDEQWRVLMATGTNHLVAISGLHVGLVAGLLWFSAQWLWRRCPRCCLRFPAPKAAAVIALAGGIGYAALAGFSLPTQRAMLMLAVVLGARLLQRPVAPLRVISLALWLIVLWQPVAVLSAGFWLSFAAVALIFFGMSGRLNPVGLWWRWGRVQAVVSLGLLPLLLAFFARGSLSAPLANLFAVPLVSLIIVPLTLLGSLLLPLWPDGGEGVLQAAAMLFQAGWPLLVWLTDHIPAMTSSAPAWTLWPALLGTAWLLLPRGWPLRGAGALLLLPLALLSSDGPSSGEAEVSLLDVGQGLAAVVRTAHHVLVFDTGPRYRSGFNTGDAVLLPFLQAQGIARLDTLIVSHGDSDHIGGARALLEHLPVRQVLTSAPHKMSWTPHQRCYRGQSWVWDGVTFEMLHPERQAGKGRGNNDSCVLKVTAGAKSLLLPGDIEVEAERQLLGVAASLRAQVLVAPHHGSKTSSSDGFVEAVQPEWVLFAVGYRNRYGFPRPEVVARYRRRSVHALETFRSGTIRFTLGNGPILPSAYRQRSQRYWHSR